MFGCSIWQLQQGSTLQSAWEFHIFSDGEGYNVVQDMEVRKAAKQMEVLWRGAKSFGDSADVFTANFPTGCILQA